MRPDLVLIARIAAALRQIDGAPDASHWAALDLSADRPRLVAVGRRNAGKSTFLEDLLGDEITSEPTFGRSTEHTWVYRHSRLRPPWLTGEVVILDAAADPTTWFDEQSIAKHLIATTLVAELDAVLDDIATIGLQVHVYLDAPILTSWTLVDTPPDDEQENSFLGYRFIRPGSADRLLHLAPAANHASQSGAARLRSALLDLAASGHPARLDLHIEFLISQGADLGEDDLTQIKQSALRQWRRELADPELDLIRENVAVVVLDRTYREQLTGQFTSTDPQRRTHVLQCLLSRRIADSQTATAIALRLAAFDAETTSLACRHAAESLSPSLTRLIAMNKSVPEGYHQALEKAPDQVHWAMSRSAPWVFEYLHQLAARAAGRDLEEFLETRRRDLIPAMAEAIGTPNKGELAASLAAVIRSRQVNISHQQLVGDVHRGRTLVQSLTVCTAPHPGPWANHFFGNENWRKGTYAAALGALPQSAIDDINNVVCESFIQIAAEWASEHRDITDAAAVHLLGNASPEEVQALMVPLLAQLVEQATTR